MIEHSEKSVPPMQGELDLLPPCPWGGGPPEPPTGAQQRLPIANAPGSRPSGTGRPVGALNKRATDLASYVHRRYGSPLEHAARFAVQPLTVIARDIGGSRLDAWYARHAALEFLARYVIPQQPKPVLVAARVRDWLGEAHLQAAQAFGQKQPNEPPMAPDC
jgi:hypothetical protein